MIINNSDAGGSGDNVRHGLLSHGKARWVGHHSPYKQAEAKFFNFNPIATGKLVAAGFVADATNYSFPTSPDWPLTPITSHSRGVGLMALTHSQKSTFKGLT